MKKASSDHIWRRGREGDDGHVGNQHLKLDWTKMFLEGNIYTQLLIHSL